MLRFGGSNSDYQPFTATKIGSASCSCSARIQHLTERLCRWKTNNDASNSKAKLSVTLTGSCTVHRSICVIISRNGWISCLAGSNTFTFLVCATGATSGYRIMNGSSLKLILVTCVNEIDCSEY